ncbi:MAG: hypothetical protein OEL66_00535 [Desulfobulbaceae bacterium]|nr:hypothetical protein [Desulfobulbaceae bacterium]
MDKLLSIIDGYGPQLGVLFAFLFVVLFVIRPLVKLLSAEPKRGRVSSGATERPLTRREVDTLVAELEESLGVGKPSLTDQEKISRLAKSDPEKAKELVRHWLRQ